MPRLAHAIVALVFASLPVTAAAQSGTALVPATPDNAAAFLGNWTLNGTGANGPASFALTVKTEAGKVLAEISGPQMPRQAIADISKASTALVLAFNFDYQGQPIPVALTLTPAEGKIGVYMDFAAGAYILEGGATKAESKPTP
jgi:hypothetical protein